MIANELHGTTLESFWATLSFILAVVITQPIYTSFSDVLGRTTPLYVSFLLFVVGSVVFAIARNMIILIVGRIVQGLGAGGLDVLGEIIVADITNLKERPLYLGLFAIPMAGGGILGPILGAFFSEFAGWRWIGWVNLPIAAVGFLLSFFFLRLKPIDQSFHVKLQRLDWVGMFLFAVGSTAFALPLSWAGAMYPWSSWKTIVPLVAGSIVLVGFGLYESKPAEPVFPYRIFQNRTALVTLIGAFIHGMVLYSVLLYAPLFFQAVFLETPLKSAISLLPLSVSTVAFSILSAVAVEVTRQYRWGIIFSWILTACGVGLWALWRHHSFLPAKSGFQIIAGMGIGTIFSILVIPMQASVQHVDDTGLAVGILVSFRLFGGLIGLAISSAVFNNVFEHRIASLGILPEPVATLKDAREAIGFIPALRSVDLQLEMMALILKAYRESMGAIFLTMAGLGAVGFLTSLFVKEITLDKEDLGRQRLETSSELVGSQ